MGAQRRERATTGPDIRELFEQALLSELRKAFPEWAAFLKEFPILIPSPRKPPDPLVIEVNNGDTVFHRLEDGREHRKGNAKNGDPRNEEMSIHAVVGLPSQ